MDLSALYELRERLRAAAIAGASLAAGDFRLSRALEGLAPLEKASPVFAKLGALTRSVLAPDCPDRAGALLDAITLCDSVLCTQGAVTAAGELSPLPGGKKGHACTNAPYSVVAPLIEALTTSGSGHYSLVQDTMSTNPGILGDYRVQEAMVKALGASYGELADNAGRWLAKEDESILPVLMGGFQPAGKKEMARRVQVVDLIAGGAANDWYLEQLPQSKKPVRPLLIYALRHRPENGELLLSLANSEKGDNKDAARWALARGDMPEAMPYWREQAEKNPTDTIRFFQDSCSTTAAVLTAELFQKELAACTAASGDLPGEKEFLLSFFFAALLGKTGEEICEFYRQAAALGTALDDRKVTEENEKKKTVVRPMTCWCSFEQNRQPFSITLVDVLTRSIQETADPMLCALAEELFEKHGGLWAAPCLCAALMTKGRQEAAAVGKRLLSPTLLQKLTGQKQQKLLLEMAFDRLTGAGQGLPDFQRPRGMAENRPAFQKINQDPVNIYAFFNDLCYYPIAAPLDPWWIELMIDHQMDQKLRTLADPSNPETCQKIAEYFHRRISFGAITMPLTAACDILIGCGWTNWKGLLSSYIKHSSKAASYWEIRSVLSRCPLSNTEKADELHSIWVHGKYSGWPEKSLEHQLEEWWKG